jgi:hypothetical protein
MDEPAQNTQETPIQYWSLNKASKELGINKSTLSNDASKGKIQWHPQQDGTKKFFAPELYTYYAERLKKRTERAERVLNTVTSPYIEHHEHNQNSNLNTALEAKAELVEMLKAQIEDVKADRDHWRKQADDAARRLDDAMHVIKALPAPANTTQEPVKRKKLFGLF